MLQVKESSVFLPSTEKKPEKFYVSAFEYPKAKYAIPDKHISPYALGVLNHVFLCLPVLQGDPFWYHAYKVRLRTQHLIGVFWHQTAQQPLHSPVKVVQVFFSA